MRQSVAHYLLLLLCACVVTSAGDVSLQQRRSFKVAVVQEGWLSDNSWNYMLGLGKIGAHERFVKTLKGMNHTVEVSTDTFEGIVPSIAVATVDALAATYNLIVVTSHTFSNMIHEAAERHPNTDFAHFTGHGAVSKNMVTGSVRMDQAMFLAGVLSGATTKTRRIGYLAPVPIPGVNLILSMLYIGAQVGAGAKTTNTSVEHLVDVIVMWQYSFHDEDRTREIIKRMKILGCDILLHNTDGIIVDMFAKQQGLLSVGQYYNQRLLMGESVITSADANLAYLLHDFMLLSYNGSLRTLVQRDLAAYTLQMGGPFAHKPSFKCPPSATLQFNDYTRRMQAGFDPACYPLRKNGVLFNPDRCMTHEERRTADFVTDGTTDMGYILLPGEVCRNGTFFTTHIRQNPPTYELTCTQCPAGTFSEVLSLSEGNQVCGVCPVGTYSGAGAWNCTQCPQGSYAAEERTSACTPCPEGTVNVGPGNAVCLEEEGTDTQFVFIVVVSSLGGVLLLVMPIVAWKVIHDRSLIQNLFSEKAIAVKCAQSIANMQLEDVDYIRAIDHPSDIIDSFIQIMDYLKEYRAYLPTALFEQIHQQNSTTSPLRRIAMAAVPPPGVHTLDATIVFTDIVSSTLIWEAVPDTMRDAIRQHNSLIRECITLYSGYEVKTIGDAFMVAFEDAVSGIRFGMKAHEQLLCAEWPAGLLEVPLCRPDVFQLWGGLTIRIGLNSGPVTIEDNSLTGRTDYFGPTVNLAARLESVCPPGGVAIPNDILLETKKLNDIRAVVNRANPLSLRGIREQVVISFLWSESLKARGECPLEAFSSSSAGSMRRKPRKRGMGQFVSNSATVGMIGLSVNEDVPEDVASCVNNSLDVISISLERTGGSIVCVIGSWVTLGWNIGRTSQSHAESSIRFIELSKRMLSDPVGICTGKVHHGEVGTTQRFMTIVGSSVSTGMTLCRLAQERGCMYLYATDRVTELPSSLKFLLEVSGEQDLALDQQGLRIYQLSEDFQALGRRLSLSSFDSKSLPDTSLNRPIWERQTFESDLM